MDDAAAAGRYDVQVDGEDWRQVGSLDEAGPGDAVFVVDDDGRLAFGDGRRGRRPPDGSLVAVGYRQGGGDSDARVSVTTRWPPPDGRYVLELSPVGVRVVGPAPCG